MESGGPQRILIVSADMGEGHNAAARAIACCAERLWPGCLTRQVDALRLMGAWFSEISQAFYRFELTRVPWTYQFFYDTLWQFPRSADATKHAFGSWCGRPLRREIRDYRPDMVIATHPFGGAALDWLRRSRGETLQIPSAIFITDFAPHPLWVHSGLDINFVMHELSIDAARDFTTGVAFKVAAPPVLDGFGREDRHQARHRLGLRRDRFIVLLTAGAWGVGRVEDAVHALLQASNRVQVVTLCGRNDALRHRLNSLEMPPRRSLPLPFVDTMAEFMAASDVVVTNAGGVTSLEAFRASRPLVLFDPIAGHGRANAALMQRAGLAIVCHSPEALAASIRHLMEDGAAERWRAGIDGRLSRGDLAEDLRSLASLRPKAEVA